MAWVPRQACRVGNTLKQFMLHRCSGTTSPGTQGPEGQGRPSLSCSPPNRKPQSLREVPTPSSSFHPRNSWWQGLKALFPRNSSRKFKLRETWQTLLNQVPMVISSVMSPVSGRKPCLEVTGRPLHLCGLLPPSPQPQSTQETNQAERQLPGDLAGPPQDGQGHGEQQKPEKLPQPGRD